MWYDDPIVEDLLSNYKKIKRVASDPEALNSLSPNDKKALLDWLEHFKYNWEFHALPKQRMPLGQWKTWIFLAGRGAGKTKTGSETVRKLVRDHGYRSIGLIAPTAADARDVMVDGKGGSSLLEITPPWEKLEYFPTKKRLVWGNGAVGATFSAEEPDRLRGPQSDLIWSDELAAWRYLQETWDQAQFGLRLGKNPKHIITSTPRPVSIIKNLAKVAVPAEEMTEDSVEDVVITRGTTMDNAENLSPGFVQALIEKYEGTRLGRQELYAEILEDNPNAIFNQSDLDMGKVERTKGALRSRSEVQFEFVMPQGPDSPQKFKTGIIEIAIAVDPSMSADIESDETGIIVMGRDAKNHLYVFEDQSGIYTPNEWAEVVLGLYEKYDADTIVAEVNQGGDLVENTIRTVERERGMKRVNYRHVRASKGKIARTEPVGALAEQHRIHHVGDLPKLEEQLVEFAPGYERSPDRLDAYVWGAHHLIIQHEKKFFAIG